MIKWFLELLGDALLISLGALSLHIFIYLNIYGEVTLVEEIDWVRYMETGLAGIVVLFGIQRLIDDLKGGNKWLGN